MGNRSVRIGLVAGCLVAGSVVLGSPPAWAAPTPACPSPSLVAAGQFSTPMSNGAPGSTGTALPPLPEPLPTPGTPAGFDMDGDGAADTITMTTWGHLEIERADGTVTIEGFFGGVGDLTFDALRSGDLDGDGTDELWGATRTQGMTGHRVGVVIPGTTPVGEHQLLDLALQFPGTVVGDVSGDGRNDALVDSPTPHHVSFVGALDHEVGAPPTIAADAPTYPLGVDVDFDGLTDRVAILDSTHGTVTFSSSGAVAPFTSPVAFGRTTFVRNGSKTWLVTGPAQIATVEQHAAFQVRSACARAWITGVGDALLGRPGTEGELGAIPPDSDPGRFARQSVTAAVLASSEGRTHLVDQAFQQLLDRPVDLAGRTYWVGALGAGRRSVRTMSAQLLGSNELFGQAGSTTPAWVALMYQRALGYAPDPAGAAYWAGQAARDGRERAANRFVATPGARRAQVRRWYASAEGFGRTATVAEAADGADLIARTGWEGFLAELTSSDASYLRAQAEHLRLP